MLEKCILLDSGGKCNQCILCKLSTDANARHKRTLLKCREELVVGLVTQDDPVLLVKRGRPSHGPPLELLHGKFHSLGMLHR